MRSLSVNLILTLNKIFRNTKCLVEICKNKKSKDQKIK